MIIEKATADDFKEIKKLYYNARIFMALSQNANQWINGYPEDEVITNDINSGNLYILKSCKKIQAAFAFIPGIDQTYNKIEGKWLSKTPYSAIHRVVSSGAISGVTDLVFNWCKGKCLSIRIDTHEDNLVMQKAILRNNFKYCGIIFTHNGTPRLAYQWDKK